MKLDRHMPPVRVEQFSMVPRSDVPRSTFATQHSHKTTFGAGYLIPVHVDEVLPGDVHRGAMTVFARMATPLFPIMDNLCLESFFFFVPARILWDNFKKFMGEQVNPADSISYTIPQTVSPASGWNPCSLHDYLGLPTVGQVSGGQTVSVNALPLRAYTRIWNDWFRDENLQNSAYSPTGDGPDTDANYGLYRRGKKHDYFTSCLPWPLKGGTEVAMPLGTSAPVVVDTTVNNGGPMFKEFGLGTAQSIYTSTAVAYSPITWGPTAADAGIDQLVWDSTALKADLSAATAATINALRLAVTSQQFLERDARGGTRYTEVLRNHFGVTPEDARLQRPEYIGGGKSYVQVSAVAQTSATGLTGGSSVIGSLAAAGTIHGEHEFSYHATEHGYILGLVHVGADLTYQQGLHKMWSRSTRFDFYWPTFAHLGEQAVLRKEIYVTGTSVQDNTVFGYQERWAEYRHRPSRLSGLFRSTSAGTIDPWHLAQKFTGAPTLGDTFIQDTPPLSRVLAAGAAADNQQILFDSHFNIKCTRPLPVYSVPGLTRF